jgi:hypothetical protein
MSEETYLESVSKLNPLQYKPQKARHWSWDESKANKPAKKKTSCSVSKRQKAPDFEIDAATWAGLLAL